MAKNELNLNYTKEQLVTKLEHPVWQLYDQKTGLYRYFAEKEDYDRAFAIVSVGEELPSDLLEKEMYNIIAPAPYTINASFVKDTKYILYGDKGVTLDFTFSTIDGQENKVRESVIAFITVKSDQYENTLTRVIAPDNENDTTLASINVDGELKLGANHISLVLSGRTTKAQRILVATFYVVELSLSSSFNIAAPVELGASIPVTYSVKGQYAKTIEFYFDGIKAPEVRNITEVEQLNVTRTFTPREVNLGAGRHHLQMRAKMETGEHTFYSNLLYFEFVVRTPEDMEKYILIKREFPANTAIFTTNEQPGLSGEQYVTSTLDWAFYTNDILYRNSTIYWKLFDASGEATTLATRTADIVDAEVGAIPTPINFMPTGVGDYQLLAYVGEEEDPTGTYTITVIPNSQGIEEALGNLTMKLSGLGRSNDEPESTISDWSYRNRETGEIVRTVFNGVTWDSNRGWLDNALRLAGGATAVVQIKPFAIEKSIHTTNGATFEIEFETFNVDDSDARLVLIGNPNSAHLAITATSAKLVGNDGTEVETKFKSDERIKLCFTVFPNQQTQFTRMMFIQNNGIRERGNVYKTAENFNMGREDDASDFGMIHLGDAAGLAGIKVYNMRTYDTAISMYQEFYNYAIDSGQNLASIIERNDIYIAGTHQISATKCEEVGDVIYLTGPVDELITSTVKKTIRVSLSRRCPSDPTRNIDSPKTTLSTAGQSTLGFPVPSLHVKLDKDGNVVTDVDGNPLNKNQYAIRKGGIPEKKFRLQANYMDSSGCHNGAFLRMINEVFPKVEIDGKHVLLTPPQNYALNTYPEEMKVKYGAGRDYTFPYTIELEPDSMPCVVFWRTSETDPYHFLGQYVIMEEKKATRTNGQRSIYDKITDNGQLDPFDLIDGKKGNRLWDNSKCIQFEHVLNETDMALFKSDAQWDERNPKTGTLLREESFEMIYPDPDDVIADGGDPNTYWEKFRDFFNTISETYVSGGVRRTRTQAEFDAVWTTVIDKYFMAAYYVLMMRHGLVDSPVRNLEWTTFDGQHWLPKFWDADTQCGLRNDGQLVLPPAIDREFIDPKSGNYAFNGHDSWLWRALENNAEFMALVPVMDAALYKAGWKYNQVVEMQDKEYVNTWAEQIYNESGEVKYTQMQLTRGGNMISMLQGSRTSHRHNWMRESYDYWDAKNVVGEYQDKAFFFRAPAAPVGSKIRVKAASETYLGWDVDQSIQESGVHVQRGDEYAFALSIITSASTSLNVFSANKLDTIDISDFANVITLINLDGCADAVTGSSLKTLNMGVPKERMAAGVFNNEASVNMSGIPQQKRLESLNIQGLKGVTSIDVNTLPELHDIYAAGSGLTEFNPANGVRLHNAELPDTVRSILIQSGKITDGAITFWHNAVQVGVPSTLRAVQFSGMGGDAGTQSFVMEWLQAIRGMSDYSDYQLSANNVHWEDVSIEDILTLCKMKKQGNVYLTGYIKCNSEYTQAQMSEMVSAFGSAIFTYGASLIFDCNSRSLIISAEGPSTIITEDGQVRILKGTDARLTAAGFPIIGTRAFHWSVRMFGDWISGDEIDPWIEFDGNRLNSLTGEIQTTENDISGQPDLVDKEYFIQCDRGDVQGVVGIKVADRTYPSEVTVTGQADSTIIEGSYVFSTVGRYTFTATHVREGGYNGNMIESNAGVWRLVTADGTPLDTTVAQIVDSNDTACTVRIYRLPEEYEMVLKYESHWKNGNVMNAEDVNLLVLGIVYNILSKHAITGNEPLFTAIEAAGVEHADSSYNSTELKYAPSELNFKELLESVEGRRGEEIVSVISEQKNVIAYLKNTTKFNFGGTGLTGDIDFSKNKRLLLVDLQGTHADAILPANQTLDLKLGYPSRIVLPVGTDATVTVDDSSEVEMVSIEYPRRPMAVELLCDLWISNEQQD